MAEDDFRALEEMIYSGRGITVGQTPSGNSFIGYSLTGRSPFSQARELISCEGTGVIRTRAITELGRLKSMFNIEDEAQLKELQKKLQEGSPALTIYPAIVPVGRDTLVASNGGQTKLLYSQAKEDILMHPKNLIGWVFEKPFYEYDEREER